MSSSFYIHLPSNTIIEGNRTCNFRVRLNKTLQFTSEWAVGLAVVSYPYSWPSIGTNDQQYIEIHWRIPTNLVEIENIYEYLPLKTKINVPKSKHFTAERLEESLMSLINVTGKELSKQLRIEYKKLKHLFLESKKHENMLYEIEKRLKILSELDKHVFIRYNKEYQRFRFFYSKKLDGENLDFITEDNCIDFVELSQQLAYVLGVDGNRFPLPNNYSLYAADMSGGITSLFVYTPGLIEPVSIGDTTAPLLRIVHVKGKPDDNIEDIYAAVQYHKILVKEITEIKVEIRTANGRLVPFEYGNCLLTLHFRKIPYY